jgi:hypothetical protein
MVGLLSFFTVFEMRRYALILIDDGACGLGRVRERTTPHTA